MEQFEKLGFSKEVLFNLKKTGFQKPTEIQEKAIPLAIAGKDIVGASFTGSGKTLVFASSIIENLTKKDYVQALVLTPTRELAEQVADSIRHFSKKNLKTLAIYGGVNIEGQINKLDNTDIVVGTPGRIIDHLKRKTLSLDKVKILVLDECDRMFDMGFHRDVEMIIQHCPKKRQTMLFSATISADIDYFIQKYTTNPEIISVASYVDPSKLKQIFYDVPDSLKFSLLVHLLKKERAKLAMIFCNTRRNVDFIADNLNNKGINAQAIHGGLEQNKRIRILTDFHENRVNILVCTDVAARGLDIKGVGHIYNYDIPKDDKDYVHRIGRTARASEEGKAINILSSRDYENFRKINENTDIKIDQEKLPYIEKVDILTNIRRRPNNIGNRFNRNTGHSSNGHRLSNHRTHFKNYWNNNRQDNRRFSSRNFRGRNSFR